LEKTPNTFDSGYMARYDPNDIHGFRWNAITKVLQKVLASSPELNARTELDRVREAFQRRSKENKPWDEEEARGWVTLMSRHYHELTGLPSVLLKMLESRMAGSQGEGMPKLDCKAYLTSPVIKAWYIFRPMLLFMVAFMIQSLLLHVATHFYIVYMRDLGHLQHNAEDPVPYRMQQGQLFDLGAELSDLVRKGGSTIPLGLLDLSGGIPALMCMGCYLYAFYTKTFSIGLWNKTFLVASFMALTKGLFDMVTILPDSSGWEVCQGRLKEEGLEALGALQFGTAFWGTVFSMFNMKMFHMRYCSDMMVSGHTYFAALFALSAYKMMMYHSMGTERKVVIRRVVKLVCIGCLLVEMFMVTMAKFHYTVDIFMAILLVLLSWDSAHIETMASDWSEGFEWRDPAWRPRNPLLSLVTCKLLTPKPEPTARPKINSSSSRLVLNLRDARRLFLDDPAHQSSVTTEAVKNIAKYRPDEPDVAGRIVKSHDSGYMMNHYFADPKGVFSHKELETNHKNLAEDFTQYKSAVDKSKELIASSSQKDPAQVLADYLKIMRGIGLGEAPPLEVQTAYVVRERLALNDPALGVKIPGLAQKAWYWIRPMFLFAFCFAMQSIMLHVATHFYLFYVDEQQDFINSVNMTAVSSEVPEKRLDRLEVAQLFDLGSVLVGGKNLPLAILDLSGGIPMLMFMGVYGISAVMGNHSIGMWVKTLMVGSFCALVKGFFDMVTILPDSSGWPHCEARLKTTGIAALSALHFADDPLGTLASMLNMKMFKLRYCSDMMVSGHTYFAVLFSLSSYKMIRYVSRDMDTAKRDMVRSAAFFVTFACICAEMVMVASTNFHYTVDILASVWLVSLAWDSAHIETLAADWSAGYDWRDAKWTPPSNIFFRLLTCTVTQKKTSGGKGNKHTVSTSRCRKLVHLREARDLFLIDFDSDVKTDQFSFFQSKAA